MLWHNLCHLHYMRFLLTYILIQASIILYKAQPISVASPTIVAPNNWSVKIKTKVDYSSNAGTLGHSFMKDLTNKTLTLTSCYYGPGILPVMTSIQDSIEIGFLPTGNYTLHYTVYSSTGVEGCNPYDTVYSTHSFYVGPTMIHESEMLSKIKIGPNPVKDQFMLKGFDASFPLEKISVYNSMGQLLIEFNDPKLNTNIPLNIPSGIYFLEIHSVNSSHKIKFIKE